MAGDNSPPRGGHQKCSAPTEGVFDEQLAESARDVARSDLAGGAGFVMSAGSDAEERAWAGEKREFVADARDEAADERDALADTRDVIAGARDVIADAREAQLDDGEAQLRARSRQSGVTVDTADVAGRGEDRSARELAGEDRADIGRDREEEKASREAATERREGESEPTLLALAFASIAEQLYDADTYDEVLTRIAAAAVATITGGESASVTMRDEDGYRTAGSTDQSAAAVDQAQYDALEGPTLDALTMPVVDAPSFPDDRWPLLGAHPIDHGVESSLSYQLDPSTRGRRGGEAASLNIYAPTPEAFDQAAREIGMILAAHASLAARAVGERATLQAMGEHLQQALLSRDVIGQAKGILMERLKTTPEDAFDILKRSSQRLNRKLREVARELTETGEVVPPA